MEGRLVEWRNRELLRVSARTLEAYAAELQRFAAWGGGVLSSPVELDRYLAERKTNGLGASGLGVAISALRSFFRFVGSTAAGALCMPRVKNRIQRTLSKAEALAVLSAIDTSTVTGARDVALIGLALASGLRASELCRLRVADVDLEKHLLTVVVKGGQMEFAVFDEAAALLLATWLSVRPTVAASDVETIFVSLRGKPLTRHGLKMLCRRLGERAGVKPFSPHALRRSFAVLAEEFGCPSALLMDAGRWKDEKVMRSYRRAASLRTFERYSPLARLMMMNP